MPADTINCEANSDVFALFVTRLYGGESDVGVTSENAEQLLALCEELGFTGFDDELRAVLGHGVDSEVRKDFVTKQDVLIEDLQSRILELESRLQDVLGVPQRVEMLEARLDQVNDMMIETKARLDCVMDQIQEVSTGIMETKERLESVESRTETYFDQTRMELLEVDSRIAGVKDMIQFTEQQLQDVRDSAGANDETATILACVEDTIGERLREVNEMVLDTKVQLDCVMSSVDDRKEELERQLKDCLEMVTDGLATTKSELQNRLEEVTTMIMDTRDQLTDVKADMARRNEVLDAPQ